MGKINFWIALIIARMVYLAIKLTKKSSGTSFAGMIALKICPNFLKYCKPYTKTAITITGTNGKTTTSGLLAHILENDNNKVIHNVKGANMLTGIANVFALNIKRKDVYDYAVLESDEAYLTKLYDYFNSDFLIVTNLFRDQLDRYGELETTASFIQNAIEKNKNLILLLNADDPLVAKFGKNNRDVQYFGFENVEFVDEQHKTSNAPTEVFNCPCGSPLSYKKQFLAQEGQYYCDNCGYKRPELNFKGYAKIYKNYTELKVVDVIENSTYQFKLNLVGLYNAYNALGAIACAITNGISYEKIRLAVESYQSIFGRSERKNIKGHEAIVQLIKNPTGASEVLKTVDLSSHIIVAINDDYADGRDISWLWDSDFEQLANVEGKITASGTRANDVATRLKYAGVPQEKIIINDDLKSAIENVVQNSKENDNITILPSYTALLKLNKMNF